MKIEVMKTVLLLFLVSLSLLLTLGIWNYQGDYETSGSDQATYSTLNGTEATKKELIQPSQLVIHEQEALMGFSDKQAELSVFNDILEWSLYDFEMIPENEEFKKDEKEKMIEIIFPASIPSYLIKELFHTDDSMLIDSQFNRIYLIADKNLTNRQIIFDNKNQDGIDIRASIQNISQVAEYFDRLGLVHDFTPLLSIEVNNQNKFYIPNQPNINGKKFRYQTFNLDSTDFQTVFFPKPANIVSSPNFDGGLVYSDGYREIVKKGFAMEFTNFTTSENQQEQENAENNISNQADFLLSNSIEYINSHDGWIGGEGIEYRLYKLSEIANTVEYRMIYNNYPVFSSHGLASISVTYQNQEEYMYNRPIMELTTSYDRASTNLLTGTQLKKYLEQSDTIALKDILDIQLGYRIQQDGQIFDLIPTWYIETYSGWQYVSSNVTSNNQGGNPNAMGAN